MLGVCRGGGSRDWAGLGAVPHLERRKVELSGRVPELVACCVGAAVHGGGAVCVDPPEAAFCGEGGGGAGSKDLFIFLENCCLEISQVCQ